MLKISRKEGESLQLTDKEGNVLFEVFICEKRRNGQVTLGIKNDPEETKVIRVKKD